MVEDELRHNPLFFSYFVVHRMTKLSFYHRSHVSEARLYRKFDNHRVLLTAEPRRGSLHI